MAAARTLRRSAAGYFYCHGVRDPARWAEVIARHLNEPLLSAAQLAVEAKCSKSLVRKILRCVREDDLVPPKHGSSATQRLRVTVVRSIIREIVAVHNAAPTAAYLSQAEIARRLPEAVHVSRSSVCRHLSSMEIGRVRANYEHPNKWTAENADYYTTFLMWRAIQVPVQQACFKFFDEARIDRTGSSFSAAAYTTTSTPN